MLMKLIQQTLVIVITLTNRYNNDFTLRKYLKSKQLITSQIGKLIIILLS